MRQVNPFKKLFRTADVCAAIRVLLALGAVIYFGNLLYHGLVTFILCSLLTDTLFLRRVFKQTFTAKEFNEQDVAWLKAKQDITPENLMVFFRKILSYRMVSFMIAAASVPLIWMIADKIWAFGAGPFLYCAVLFLILHRLSQHSYILPRRYRPTARSFRSQAHGFDNEHISNPVGSVGWNLRWNGTMKIGL